MKPIHFRDGDGERFVFPDAIELTILIPGSATAGAFANYEENVQPRIGLPRHIHTKQEEVFFVCDGNFDIEIDGQLLHAKVGDIAFVPRGTVHAFKNVGRDPGRLRYTFTPAGNTEAMFHAFYEAVQGGQFTQQQMTEIAGRHDQIIVGPPL